MWFVGRGGDVAIMPVFCPTRQRKIRKIRSPEIRKVSQRFAYCAWGCFRRFCFGYPRRRAAAAASTTFSTSSRQFKISIASTG